MTRGDEIRRMSNEQLVDNYLCFTRCGECRFLEECEGYIDLNRPIRNIKEERKLCRKLWLAWLNEEVGQ